MFYRDYPGSHGAGVYGKSVPLGVFSGTGPLQIQGLRIFLLLPSSHATRPSNALHRPPCVRPHRGVDVTPNRRRMTHAMLVWERVSVSFTSHDRRESCRLEPDHHAPRTSRQQCAHFHTWRAIRVSSRASRSQRYPPRSLRTKPWKPPARHPVRVIHALLPPGRHPSAVPPRVHAQGEGTATPPTHRPLDKFVLDDASLPLLILLQIICEGAQMTRILKQTET